MPSASGLSLALVGFVLLAGGFATGYLVGSGGDPDPIADVLPPPAESPVQPRVPPPVEAPVEAPRLESPRAVELEPLRTALEALPPPTVPRGSGSITGCVKTKEGQPMKGVEVSANPEMPKALRGKRPREGGELDLPTAVRRYVNGVRWRELARQQAVTGADGRYRLEGLTDAPHRLRATREGWRIRAVAQAAYQAKAGSTVDFEANPISQVRVQVYLPDGSQPEKASLNFRSPDMGTGRHWSAEDPLVEIDPGTYTVTATAGEAREFTSKPVRVTVERGGASPEIRLDLEGRPVLRGRVIFPEGQQTQSAYVRILKLRDGQAADPALLTVGTEETSLHMHRGQGTRFNFDDLKPGRYLVGVTRTWQGTIVASKPVELRAGVTETEIEIPPLGREEYVVLRARGPDGKLLPDVSISTGFRSEGSSSSSGSVVIDRPDGDMWVLHHGNTAGQADAKNPRLWISVTHVLYGTREFEYALGTAPEFDFRFGEPGTVDVTVSGLAGSDYEGRVQVQLRQGDRTHGSGRGHHELDDRGGVVLEGVQPGEYEVVLLLKAGRFGGSEIGREAVAVRPGANPVRIPLPALHEVTFEGLEGHAFLSREGADRFHRVVTVTSGGRAVIDGLPAGTYVVRTGPKTAKFSLPGATTVRIE